MSLAAVDRAAALILHATRDRSGPLLVAVDGRSGTGKSTLARTLAARLAATVIEGDDFYAGGVGILGDPPASRAARCIDWQSQRRVLTTLRSGRPASYRAFDWDAFDGSLADQPTSLAPSPVVILEGVYSARPELRDILDLALLATVPDAVRLSRLTLREGEIAPWERQWHEAEDWYFATVCPPTAFDLVLDLT